MLKHCKDCHADKPLSEFYEKSGRVCKACARERMKQYRIANLVRIRSEGRARMRKAATMARRAQYLDQPGVRERMAEQGRTWRAKHAARFRAVNILNRAIKRKLVARPDRCDRCGDRGKVLPSLADYAKPLEVTWMCFTCRAQERQYGRVDRQDETAQAEGQSAAHEAAPRSDPA
jgi:hypothetical protein